MTPLGLIWTMVCLMTTVSCQTLSESDFVRYPRINDTEVLTCECSSRSCQTVYWFRTLHNNLDFQFLLSLNNAGRTNHESSVDKHRFQASKRDGGSKMTFTLRLINISSEDAGLYTCMLQNQKENELWRPGVLLRPGETRPTLLPVTKPQPQGIPNSIPNGRCTKSNYQTPKGCGSKVLWPLVGVLMALAVALISTLYYFSRKDHWSNSEHPDCRLRDSAVFTVCVLTGISFHFMNLKTVLLASYFSILCSLQRRNSLKFQLSKREHLGFCSQC
uniref:Cd8 beta n=1 Tax=Oncorhynchus kisutch TaxID=8019 RepID=A0A8C7HJS5_ONCKI